MLKFEEHQHPRVKGGKGGGQFTSKGGGDGGGGEHPLAGAGGSDTHQTSTAKLKETLAKIAATTDPEEKKRLTVEYAKQILKKHHSLMGKASGNADKFKKKFDKLPEDAKKAAIARYGAPKSVVEGKVEKKPAEPDKKAAEPPKQATASKDETKKDTSHWVTGAGKDEVVGKRPHMWRKGEFIDFKNRPQDWKTVDDVKEAFQGRHGFPIVVDRLEGLSDAAIVEKARFLDQTLTDLHKRMPRLFATDRNGVHLHQLGGGVLFKKGNNFVAEGHPNSRANGSYHPMRHEMKIASGLPTRDTNLLRGQWIVSTGSMAGTFRHEFGHAVETMFEYAVRTSDGFGVMKPEEAKSFSIRRIYNQEAKEGKIERTLSRYGASNHMEYFAESFAAYTHPEYGQGKGAKVHPILEALFDKVFGK